MSLLPLCIQEAQAVMEYLRLESYTAVGTDIDYMGENDYLTDEIADISTNAIPGQKPTPPQRTAPSPKGERRLRTAPFVIGER